jgi:hypothetical protein
LQPEEMPIAKPRDVASFLAMLWENVANASFASKAGDLRVVKQTHNGKARIKSAEEGRVASSAHQ